jgi:hypothetical protein
MKTLFSRKILSAALIATALAAVGSVPASAQTLSHYGSLMPHYFDKNGELKWGGWAPAAPEHQAAIPSHTLYLYAGHAHRNHVRSR